MIPQCNFYFEVTQVGLSQDHPVTNLRIAITASVRLTASIKAFVQGLQGRSAGGTISVSNPRSKHVNQSEVAVNQVIGLVNDGNGAKKVLVASLLFARLVQTSRDTSKQFRAQGGITPHQRSTSPYYVQVDLFVLLST